MGRMASPSGCSGAEEGKLMDLGDKINDKPEEACECCGEPLGFFGKALFYLCWFFDRFLPWLFIRSWLGLQLCVLNIELFIIKVKRALLKAGRGNVSKHL